MSKQDAKLVSETIPKNVGGKDNVKSVEHCATRLRLILKDKDLIDEEAVESIEGVKGQFFGAGQYQVVLGTGFVNKVFKEMSDLESNKDHKEELFSEMNAFQKVSRVLGDIFVPIIPVLVATGLFMGLRGLIVNLGVELNPTFEIFSQILTDVAFIFLPALVAWSTVKRFGGTPVIGIVLGLMLVAPQLPNAWEVVGGGGGEPLRLTILGLNIAITGYQGSVIPALVVGIIGANIEKAVRKVVPDVLDLIVTPFITLLISMVLGLLVIGPIMYQLEHLILDLFMRFLSLPLGLGGLIIGGLQQLVVVTGVHHVFNALEINLLAETGLNPFNAIITGAIAAQGAATLAVALKAKDKRRKSLYISSAIPAFLGITEPAIFGVNLRFIKPFVFGLVGGAAAGMTASLINLAGTGMGVTVLPGALLYLGENMIGYILVHVIGMAVAFALTYVFFDEEKM